jgi:hypothetical protein
MTNFQQPQLPFYFLWLLEGTLPDHKGLISWLLGVLGFTLKTIRAITNLDRGLNKKFLEEN